MTLLEDILQAYYKYFIYIDIRVKKSCMQNPRRIYTAI